MSLKNENWNENAAVWVTFGNGPQGFSQHRYILMHHSTVSPSWAEPTEKPLVMVLRVCPSCSVWRWQVWWVAVTQGLLWAASVAMPWLDWEWLEMPSWDCRSSAGCSTALPHPRPSWASLGAPFLPQPAAPHPQLPREPQLWTTPFTGIGHLHELPPGL